MKHSLKERMSLRCALIEASNCNVTEAGICAFSQLVLTTLNPQNDNVKTPVLIDFCFKAGLPITFAEMGLDPDTNVKAIAKTCAKTLDTTPRDLQMAMIKINMWGEKAQGHRNAAILAKELRGKLGHKYVEFAKDIGDCLLFFGDSQMSSLHWATHAGYPDILAEFLSDSFKVINAEIGGNTTQDALKRIDSDVISHNPDLVFVCFGGNDANISKNTGLPETNSEQYEANLTTIAEKILKMGSKLVLITPVRSPANDRRQKLFEEYVSKVHSVSKKLNVPLIDIYDAMKGHSTSKLISFDEIHLSTMGHLFMAEKILESARIFCDSR